MQSYGNQKSSYDPTPDEIAAECQKIREENLEVWTNTNTRRRPSPQPGRGHGHRVGGITKRGEGER